MKRDHAASLLISLAAFLACRPRAFVPDESINAAPSSTEVLSRANEAYKKLESYQDEGTSVTTFGSLLGRHTDELHFTTAYTRSGKFRFEYWEPRVFGGENRMVVWKDGKAVKSWWSIDPKVETHRGIGGAISGATGVSGGTAYLVPSVLMDEAAWKGCTWTCPEGTYRIEDGVEGSTSFYRVQRLTANKSTMVNGRRLSGTTGKVTYWIAKETFQLVRVDKETDFDDFATKQCVRYSARINAALPDKAFEFAY